MRLKTFFLAATALTADEKAGASAAMAQDTSLGEVVVTARRSEERLQDVPIAVSAIGSENLQQLDVQTTNDVALYTPSLQFTDATVGFFGGRLQTRPIVIRGLNLSTGGVRTQVTHLEGY